MRDLKDQKRQRYSMVQPYECFGLRHCVKLSTPRPDGLKVQSFEEPPKGLENHKRACFANAGLQGLFGVPELIKHYEVCKEQISQKMQSIRRYTSLMRAGKATRGLSNEGEELNVNINKAEW